MWDRLETLPRWKWESFYFQLLENHRDTFLAVRRIHFSAAVLLRNANSIINQTENYRGHSAPETSHHFDNFLLLKARFKSPAVQWKKVSYVIKYIITFTQKKKDFRSGRSTFDFGHWTIFFFSSLIGPSGHLKTRIVISKVFSLHSSFDRTRENFHR